MKLKIMMVAMLLVLLTVACQPVEETQTADPQSIILDSTEVPREVVELRINDGSFSPSLVQVVQGTEVEFHYMGDDPIHFSLETINEPIGAGHFVTFVADEVGTFEFSCLDCDETATGLIQVS